MEGGRHVSGYGVPVQRENDCEERFQDRSGTVARSRGKVPMVRSLRSENVFPGACGRDQQQQVK
eukprot:2611486-Pleurochrysis_carterae.AAC.1